MTDMTKRVFLREVTDRASLAGRPAALLDRPKIEEAALAKASDGGWVVVDFEGIAVMTASYFDAGLWPLWGVVPRDRGLDALHPVLANIGQDVIDDVAIGLREHGGAAWVLTGDAPRLIGKVDDGTRRLLAALEQREPATAADLEGLDSIVRTAWSNRLAALYDQRLVRRQKDGKRLLYSVSWRSF